MTVCNSGGLRVAYFAQVGRENVCRDVHSALARAEAIVAAADVSAELVPSLALASGASNAVPVMLPGRRQVAVGASDDACGLALDEHGMRGAESPTQTLASASALASMSAAPAGQRPPSKSWMEVRQPAWDPLPCFIMGNEVHSFIHS